jgi:hypothetical protein
MVKAIIQSEFPNFWLIASYVFPIKNSENAGRGGTYLDRAFAILN